MADQDARNIEQLAQGVALRAGILKKAQLTAVVALQDEAMALTDFREWRDCLDSKLRALDVETVPKVAQ